MMNLLYIYFLIVCCDDKTPLYINTQTYYYHQQQKTSTENIMFIFGEGANTLSSYFWYGACTWLWWGTADIHLRKFIFHFLAFIIWRIFLVLVGSYVHIHFSILKHHLASNQTVLVRVSTVSVSSHVHQYFVLFLFSCYCLFLFFFWT